MSSGKCLTMLKYSCMVIISKYNPPIIFSVLYTHIIIDIISCWLHCYFLCVIRSIACQFSQSSIRFIHSVKPFVKISFGGKSSVSRFNIRWYTTAVIIHIQSFFRFTRQLHKSAYWVVSSVVLTAVCWPQYFQYVYSPGLQPVYGIPSA